MKSPPTLPLPPEDENDSRPLVVEWYRVDQSPQVVRVLMVAAPILLIGCLGVAFAVLATHRTPIVRAIVGLVGACGNVGGPLYAIFGLRHILMQDSYIALRTDGIAIRDNIDETLHAWDDIIDVRSVDNTIVIDKRDDTTHTITLRFAGITHAALAKRVEHVRKRAALGMRITSQRARS